MLYKVTPMLVPAEKKPREPSEPGEPRGVRKKRRSAVFDHEGQEVLITLMCLKCRQIKPLVQFGLRKMADGAIRNQPWCRGCRSGAGVKKPEAVERTADPESTATLPVDPPLAAYEPVLAPVMEAPAPADG